VKVKQEENRTNTYKETEILYLKEVIWREELKNTLTVPIQIFGKFEEILNQK